MVAAVTWASVGRSRPWRTASTAMKGAYLIRRSTRRSCCLELAGSSKVHPVLADPERPQEKRSFTDRCQPTRHNHQSRRHRHPGRAAEGGPPGGARRGPARRGGRARAGGSGPPGRRRPLDSPAGQRAGAVGSRRPVQAGGRSSRQAAHPLEPRESRADRPCPAPAPGHPAPRAGRGAPAHRPRRPPPAGSGGAAWALRGRPEGPDQLRPSWALAGPACRGRAPAQLRCLAPSGPYGAPDDTTAARITSKAPSGSAA